jgi:hypothetical protein
MKILTPRVRAGLVALVAFALTTVLGMPVPLASAADAGLRLNLKVGAALQAPRCASGWGGRLQVEIRSSRSLRDSSIVVDVTSYANVNFAGRFGLSVRLANVRLTRTTIRYCLESRSSFAMLLVTASDYGDSNSKASNFNPSKGNWVTYSPRLTS